MRSFRALAAAAAIAALALLAPAGAQAEKPSAGNAGYTAVHWQWGGG